MLDPQDDAATANWGDIWQTPSMDQWGELLDEEYVTWTYTSMTGKEGFLNYGLLIKSKQNGNSIFLPASGSFYNSGVWSLDTYWQYWTNELLRYNGQDASTAVSENLYYEDGKIRFFASMTNRCYGQPVRPVIKKTGKEVYTEFVASTGTLTYYYDDQRASRSGETSPYDPVGSTQKNCFSNYSDKIYKAVIDPSMKDAPLTSTAWMFFGGYDEDPFEYKPLSNLTTIEGLSNLNTENVTNMSEMFLQCSSLKTLDLSSFNTKNTKNMSGMFAFCRGLQTVNVSSFDISNAENLATMFYGCSSLTTIYCYDDWSESEAYCPDMFYSCTSLVGGQGTTFDDTKTDVAYARPDGGTSKPGYFTHSRMVAYTVKYVDTEGNELK